MDKIPSRFFNQPSQAKGVTLGRLKPPKLQRQTRCQSSLPSSQSSSATSSVDSCFMSSAIENLLLSLQMYDCSSRLLARLSDDYYNELDYVLNDKDRDNLQSILALRQDILDEVVEIDIHLKHLLTKVKNSSFQCDEYKSVNNNSNSKQIGNTTTTQRNTTKEIMQLQQKDISILHIVNED